MKHWEPRKESLWSRPLGSSLSCHQLLTVVSDWRIFLIALRVIWLDGLNILGMWLVKRKWHLWQLSSAEPAWKWDSQRSWPKAFFSFGSAFRSALRVANFQINKIILKESPWDQGRWAQTRSQKSHHTTTHWSTHRNFKALHSSCPFYGQHRTSSPRTHQLQ